MHRRFAFPNVGSVLGPILGLALSGAAATAPLAADLAVGPPASFVSAHGRRAAVFGYSAQGLEVWAYPLQVLNGYRLRFREAGRTTPLDGEALLRRVEVGPAGTSRVYVGPDFTVRERLVVAPDAPGARIDYEVAGRPDVQLEVSFKPSLDLMWPGALGGQDVAWDAGRKAYVERQAQQGFSATISSAETVDHDAFVNAAVSQGETRTLVLQPRAEGATGVRRASLAIAADLGEAGGASAPPTTDEPAQGLRIVTPDPALDAAVADAQRALDQAWVCAPRIGCGEVAGYGPSRPGRRPQYAWYFAGDGLVAAEGLLASGRYERAREEIAFVARFQNPANGMIWHEMSLSAPYIDWARYPYMYVHVDITLQYLSTLARYAAATGDDGFLAQHWKGVSAAWRYARSLIDPRTDLPTIPAGKQGQNEQLRLADDVRLSSAWIGAADAMAELDRRTGRAAEAREVEAAAARARKALSAEAWDAARGFWVEGRTASGERVEADRSDASGLLAQHVLTPAQAETALDHLAAPAFRTDWGERSLSADAKDYDPNAYSQGAVWALGTSGAAEAFFRAHRPLVGWSLLRGLAAWNTLDSPGHLHEVLAGDLYHAEIESVPEQTWSSAGLIMGVVHGLFGVQADGAARRLALAPHLPAAWDRAEVDGVRVGAARLDLRFAQTAGTLSLDIVNSGAPVAVDFAPEIPLGAADVVAELDGRPVAATVEPHAQDQHARVRFTAAAGATRLVLRYRGGVRVAPALIAPQVGDPSRNLQIGAVRMEGDRLDIQAYVADPDRAEVDLLTPLTAGAVQGGRIAPAGDGRLRLTLQPDADAPVLADGYRAAHASIRFAPRATGP